MIEFFRDGDGLEDHNTFDMGATTVGAPLRQEQFNPSLHYRRFPRGEARGVATKFYISLPTISLLRLRFLSRVRSSDDPVLPVTPGNLCLWIGFRDNPDFAWRYHQTAVAHPSQNLTTWQPWTIDLANLAALVPLNVLAGKFYQMSIVRKGDHAIDTATDTDWDLLFLHGEIHP